MDAPRLPALCASPTGYTPRGHRAPVVGSAPGRCVARHPRRSYWNLLADDFAGSSPVVGAARPGVGPFLGVRAAGPGRGRSGRTVRRVPRRRSRCVAGASSAAGRRRAAAASSAALAFRWQPRRQGSPSPLEEEALVVVRVLPGPWDAAGHTEGTGSWVALVPIDVARVWCRSHTCPVLGWGQLCARFTERL